MVMFSTLRQSMISQWRQEQLSSKREILSIVVFVLLLVQKDPIFTLAALIRDTVSEKKQENYASFQ
jgi:hypothetical protein